MTRLLDACCEPQIQIENLGLPDEDLKYWHDGILSIVINHCASTIEQIAIDNDPELVDQLINARGKHPLAVISSYDSKEHLSSEQRAIIVLAYFNHVFPATLDDDPQEIVSSLAAQNYIADAALLISLDLGEEIRTFTANMRNRELREEVKRLLFEFSKIIILGQDYKYFRLQYAKLCNLDLMQHEIEQVDELLGFFPENESPINIPDNLSEAFAEVEAGYKNSVKSMNMDEFARFALEAATGALMPDLNNVSTIPIHFYYGMLRIIHLSGLPQEKKLSIFTKAVKARLDLLEGTDSNIKSHNQMLNGILTTLAEYNLPIAINTLIEVADFFMTYNYYGDCSSGNDVRFSGLVFSAIFSLSQSINNYPENIGIVRNEVTELGKWAGKLREKPECNDTHNLLQSLIEKCQVQ